jgi:hypothetical protein
MGIGKRTDLLQHVVFLPFRHGFRGPDIRIADLYLLVKDCDSQGHERMLWPAVFVVLGRVVVVF